MDIFLVKGVLLAQCAINIIINIQLGKNLACRQNVRSANVS